MGIEFNLGQKGDLYSDEMWLMVIKIVYDLCHKFAIIPQRSLDEITKDKAWIGIEHNSSVSFKTCTKTKTDKCLFLLSIGNTNADVPVISIVPPLIKDVKSFFTMGKFISNVTKTLVIDNGCGKLLEQNIAKVVSDIPTELLYTCLSKNTPVILHRNTYTLNLMGIDYPLFCDNEDELEKMETDYSKISSAYVYLKKIDWKLLFESKIRKAIEICVQSRCPCCAEIPNFLLPCGHKVCDDYSKQELKNCLVCVTTKIFAVSSF